MGFRVFYLKEATAMIIVMKQDAEQQQVDGIIHELEEGYGVQVQINSGVDCTCLLYTSFGLGA